MSALKAALAFVGLTALAGPLPAVAAPEPGYLRMKKAELVDQHGFEKPIPALSLLVPTDWTVESNVAYYKLGSSPRQGLMLRATGPDGRSLELLPPYDWTWADNPAVVQQMQREANRAAQRGARVAGVLKPAAAADFLRDAVKQLLPKCHLVAVEPLAELTEALQQNAKQREARGNGRLQVRADAARARLTGPATAGAPTEVWLTAIVENVGTATKQGFIWSSEARALYVFRAPQGQLQASAKLHDTMISSARLDPEWLRRTNEQSAQLAAIKAKGERDRAKIRSDTQREIADMKRGSVAVREQAQDDTNKKTSQYLRDVETYRDDRTGQKVELSNQYGHAWKSASGEYLLSDGPNFDPNTVSNQSWHPLDHADP